MRLKAAILSVLGRDDLEHIVDDLEIDGVDRRSAEDMRAALSRARRATVEELLAYMRKDQIQEVCELAGVSGKGKRDELVERLLEGGQERQPKRKAAKATKKGTPMASDDTGTRREKQKELPLTFERENGKKLDVSALEGWLWEAACVIRGPLDAPKFKDYILPLIFLKRLSDVFEDEIRYLAHEATAAKLVEQDHKLVRFFIPKQSRWSAIATKTTGVGRF